MHIEHALFRALFGQRLPTTAGTLRVRGARQPVVIRRDRWAIPHIEAEQDADAWYGLGFCHGQDRTYQLESLLRVVRGTIAELIGRDGLPVDRLSRRIGFRRAAEQQLALLAPDIRASVEAYARGVSDGGRLGLRRRPHEFVLMRRAPAPWTPADVLGVLKLQSFMVASNWDTELARMRMLVEDGPEALAALDPTAPRWLPSAVLPDAKRARPPVRRLVDDVAAFLAMVGGGGGASNAWALAPGRTASGRPLLANDPHLGPALPSQWYLAHIVTPQWAVAGASFVGGPGIVAGHNGFAAWGMTAALVDNTDLALEEVGPGGRSVCRGGEFVACGTRAERIDVRGGAPVTEEALETPDGPVIGPPPPGLSLAISLRATWLKPLPADGPLRLPLVRGFDDFRQAFSQWPAIPLAFAYADASGTIGKQVVATSPRRRSGLGAMPQPGWGAAQGWDEEPVPFDEQPYEVDPAEGIVVVANGPPAPEGSGPFLGVDWLDTYREERIREALSAEAAWDVRRTQALQLDTRSLPWREMRDAVLDIAVSDAAASGALRLLSGWDGRVASDSPAAAVFELFLAGLAHRIVAAKAPASACAARPGMGALLPQALLLTRGLRSVTGLLRERPWEQEIEAALASAVRRLAARQGGEPSAWAWGRVRPMTFPHGFGRRKPLDRIFNAGPFPWGGDTNTVAQAGISAADPLAPPTVSASMRMVIDVGAWENSRFALAGGQSGNPLSPHYADLLPLWRRGGGVPIAWSPGDVERATRETLRLEPAEARTGRGLEGHANRSSRPPSVSQ